MKFSINIRTNKSMPIIVLALALVLLSVTLYILSNVETGSKKDTLAAWEPASRPGDMASHNPTKHSAANGIATLTRSNGSEVQGGAGGSSKDSPNNSYYSRGWNAEYQWWQISRISTLGFDRIELTFFVRGSDTGPKNFTLEYSLNGIEWLPLTNSSGASIRYYIAPDNKFHQQGPHLLSAAVSNLDELHIRFNNTNNESVSGDEIKS